MSATLSPDRVKCTVMRHAWDTTTTAPFTRKPLYGVVVDFVCTRCGTYRRDVVDSWVGNLIHRSYRHPLDYSVPKGETPKLDEVRLAYLDQIGKGRPRKARRKAATT